MSIKLTEIEQREIFIDVSKEIFVSLAKNFKSTEQDFDYFSAKISDEALRFSATFVEDLNDYLGVGFEPIASETKE